MALFEHYEQNTEGRDFAVSDLHGMFGKFYEALERVKFDPKVDRVFSGGDLVDRGANSYRCLKLVEKPWFKTVRGNHEDMCLMGLSNPDRVKWHQSHGGSWLYELPKPKQLKVAGWVNALPYAMEIETERGLVGMVHADCIVPDWAMIRDALTDLNDDSPAILSNIVWGSSRYEKKITTEVAGVYRVIVGHIPMRDTTVLGNVTYIDGGACYGKTREVRIIQL